MANDRQPDSPKKYLDVYCQEGGKWEDPGIDALQRSGFSNRQELNENCG
jgi:hypothetical protein